jgi:hypothetical protein
MVSVCKSAAMEGSSVETVGNSGTGLFRGFILYFGYVVGVTGHAGI